MNREVIVTGASGFIGRQVVRTLQQRGWLVIGITRDPVRARERDTLSIRWLPFLTGEAEREIMRVGQVIHLAGAHPFERRWNAGYKKLIWDSRIGSTERIVDLLAQSIASRKVLVSSSGTGYYGNCGDDLVTETRPRGKAWFLTEMEETWENAALKASKAGSRAVVMRIGISLGRDGGALPIVEQNFRRRMGGHVGTGLQYLAWIHNADTAAMYATALEDEHWSGVYNCTAPEPRTFAEFARCVGATLGRRSWFHLRPMMARLLIGEASAILMESQKVIPERALAQGFVFRYPTLEKAISAIYA